MLIGTNFKNTEFGYFYLRKFKNYKFVYGSPVELAKKILNKEIDIAPISSIFYVLYSEKFLILPEFSISAKGKTNSILLFSKKYRSLDKKCLDKKDKINVGIPENSATSVNLLKIILNLKNIDANYVEFKVQSFEEALEKNDYTLLIGNDAIVNILLNNKYVVCDLGEEYYKLTGRGVVYALWMTNKEKETNKEYNEIYKNFFNDLKISLEYSYKNFDFVIQEITKDIKNPELKDCYKENISHLDYTLNKENIDDLKEFFNYLKKFGIIKTVPFL